MSAILISNSGGKTSGFMTWREIQKGLSPDTFIVFANTGKEREETLEFLHDQEINWGIKIWWIERDVVTKWREVNFETASRNGEPFEQLITKKNYLPNVVTRYCTSELKIRVMRDFMRSQGFNEWTNMVGIRYDEQHRAANAKAQEYKQRWTNEYPLLRDKITKQEVNDFWEKQSFNLNLKPHEGNCDLCFLKGRDKLVNIIRDDPPRAKWWIEMEKSVGGTFRKNVPVDFLVKLSQQKQLDLFNEPTVGCFCGD